jgi:hypothetical protein
MNIQKRKRGFSTAEGARLARQSGHDDAITFARAIGMEEDYQNNKQAKKDVWDPSGDTHSVKSGKVKWQLFLYRESRFTSDSGFVTMNGIGDLLIECINCFPKDPLEYQSNKTACKIKLQTPMRAICEKLQCKKRLRSFLEKSIFDGRQVDYLTIKEGDVYLVFGRDDIIKVLSENLEVCNSIKRNKNSIDAQKVLFKYNSKNIIELEMRNESPEKGHYREIRLNMMRPRAIELFIEKIKEKEPFNDLVIKYGSTIKTFGRWIKR